MMLNTEIDKTTYSELMSRLDFVQQITLCTPRDTAGDVCGFLETEQTEDSSCVREFDLTQGSMRQLKRITGLVDVQYAPRTQAWPHLHTALPARAFIVGLDATEHALDVDAEIATADFAKSDSLKHAFAELYESRGRLSR